MAHTQISIKELDELAKTLAIASQGERVWLFFGEMGAGKTTLIRHICAHLGVKGRISSPTFSIVNEYRGAQNTSVYHFDFYRLQNKSEVYDIGLEEYFHSGAYCFVEWPEIITSMIPKPYFKVKITPYTPLERVIEYTLTKPYDKKERIRI